MISNRLWKILVTFKSCKTLSATAERLFVSQPSISSSMKMLEKELGVQLFDRSKNKIVLNEVGLEAAQLAEDYLKREGFYGAPNSGKGVADADVDRCFLYF